MEAFFIAKIDKMNRYALIVAGGSGKRMKSEIPKQFLKLAGKPILMYTLERFFSADETLKLLVLLPKDHIATWQSLCNEHQFIVPHEVIMGGKERFFSVKNGLDRINDKTALVAIHDGVRPFISVEKISHAFEKTRELKATALAVDLKDSIRVLDGDDSKAVDRSLYKLIQTPQTFEVGLIQKAYEQKYSGAFTDDASVLEAIGEKVHLIEGEYENIKITSPEDLIVGGAILKEQIQAQ